MLNKLSLKDGGAGKADSVARVGFHGNHELLLLASSDSVSSLSHLSLTKNNCNTGHFLPF